MSNIWLDKLNEIESEEDMAKVMHLSSSLLSDQDFSKALKQMNGEDNQAVCTQLNKTLDRLNKHIGVLTEQGLDIRKNIDDVKKISDACVAYTKAQKD